MARFPQKQAQIMTLAEKMIAPLAANPAILPNPPRPAYGPGVGLSCKQNRCNPRRQDAAAYKVQRRLRGSGDYQDVATAILTEATLVDQPRGAELDYRVIAVNKAGDGPESNTVEAVL